jgi:hypothetical protein
MVSDEPFQPLSPFAPYLSIEDLERKLLEDTPINQRRRYSRLTEEKLLKIKEMYYRGCPELEIVKTVGMCRSMVIRVKDLMGYVVKRPHNRAGRPRKGETKHSRWERLRNEGRVGYREIQVKLAQEVDKARKLAEKKGEVLNEEEVYEAPDGNVMEQRVFRLKKETQERLGDKRSKRFKRKETGRAPETIWENGERYIVRTTEVKEVEAKKESTVESSSEPSWLNPDEVRPEERWGW